MPALSEPIWLLIANTVLFIVLGVIAAMRTGDTKWPFAFGFFSLLPATLILAWYGAGAEWRRIGICLLVAIYVARMLYTLLVWFNATGAAKLKDQSPRGALIGLPFVLVPVFCWLYPLPFFAAMDRTEGFGWFDGAALLCYGLGTVFHMGADLQKWRFKQEEANRGKLLRRGFWGMSRHPNYFGDFLIYCSFAIVSVWPWGLISPLVNLGQYFADAIPKNEKQSKARHNGAWDAYARETPIFLPLGRPTAKGG
ncbi:DUF1295 domain-containing protein [Notoacmeibacter marinus]|uniref:DUF1295 domain-containing protein n=1 Tax=Notoacmeibacter marinus TaxID=1876515 RepID=UPI000DF136E6|nr:DUF1295 domain-containing protein [Notoacmeibacter marinus]